MRIFLTGATGFIGGHLLRAFCAQGYQVTCLAREKHVARLEAMAFANLRVIAGEFSDPSSWIQHLANHDVVVNAVGIIRETKKASFANIHTHAPIAMFDAAAQVGIGKIIQISALGADREAQSQFHLSKKAADDRLSQLGIPYVVLRPSFVYGPNDHSMTFFTSLAALPATPIPGDGQYRAQPIHVGDLVRAVMIALEKTSLPDTAVDVGGEEILTFDAMLDVLGRWLGRSQGVRKLHIPWGIMEVVARLGDSLAGGPITSEELSMLRRGNCGENKTFVEHFGFSPTGFTHAIARTPYHPATAQYARFTHLRIPLRLTLAFIWIATGIVSAFVYPETESLKLLAQVGLSGDFARFTLYATSYAEILLGLALAVGYRVRFLGIIQLLLIFGFTGILSIFIPEFWVHPFGPLTKNIPIIGAILASMAVEE